MSDKIIERGQMAGDPELQVKEEDEHKSFLMDERDDPHLQRKVKWRWKPSRLIFLWLFLQSFQIAWMYLVIWATTNYMLEINIGEKQIGGIIVLLIAFKTWWYKKSNDESK